MKYLYFDSKKELMNWYLEEIFHDNRQWQEEIYDVSKTKTWFNYWQASQGGKNVPDELREKATELLSEAVDKANYHFPICVTIETVDTDYKVNTCCKKMGKEMEKQRESEDIYYLIEEWEEKWQDEYVLY